MSEDCRDSNNDSNFKFDYDSQEFDFPVSSPITGRECDHSFKTGTCASWKCYQCGVIGGTDHEAWCSVCNRWKKVCICETPEGFTTDPMAYTDLDHGILFALGIDSKTKDPR